jgi:hypothetical protein
MKQRAERPRLGVSFFHAESKRGIALLTHFSAPNSESGHFAKEFP